MTVHSYVFGVIVACVSYLVYQRYVNLYPSIVTKPDKRYDYIIVGAGTAGCVLAARLSEDPKVTVLLVEAGSHMGYFTKIPLTPTAAQQGPDDWSVRSKPQKYSSFGMWDQTQIIPRGKGLGGSGQINFLLHGFGLPEDYERWSARGFHGWGMEDLKPYFFKAFGTDKSEFESQRCSGDGRCYDDKVPMKLRQIEEDNDLLTVFKQASEQLRNNRTIFRKATATVQDGVRVSTLDGYLKKAMNRRNLHVVLRTQAVSIRFENNTASSLFILRHNRELDNVFVNRDIVLCAGAVKTPQILIMSGIGPRDVIQRLKIKIVAENKAVGRNLHDHMNFPVYVSIQKPISIILPKVFTFGTVWDYFMNGKGLLSFPPVAAVEYHDASALLLFSMGTTSERLLRDLSNYKLTVFRNSFPFHNDSSREGFMFLATCAQPRSRGSVTVKDVSINVPPVVDPAYLHSGFDVKCMIKGTSRTSTPRSLGSVTLRDVSINVPPVVDPAYLHSGFDVKCMIKAIRQAERLVSSPPFQKIGARIHWPRPERCLSLWNYTRGDQIGPERKRKRKIIPDPPNQAAPKEKQTEEKPKKPLRPPDAFLECLLREVAVTGHHVGGTAAGGAVVDDQLRVKSVSGLRVMDASVLPSPLSLFPNSVLVAMAEKAADIIRKSIIS